MNNKILGYTFKNLNLLKQALTHPSLCSKSNGLESYERLELLGDSVLNLVIIDHLLIRFPYEDEGKIARRKAALVEGETLAQIAIEHNIGSYLQISVGEERAGGRKNHHSLENALEAIIAAIFLDSDFITAKEIVLTVWKNKIEEMKEIPIDAKSKLQEELQSRGLGLPKYELIEKSGPDHMLTFRVKVEVPGFQVSIGVGSSKQAAEKQAALNFLSYIL